MNLWVTQLITRATQNTHGNVKAYITFALIKGLLNTFNSETKRWDYFYASLLKVAWFRPISFIDCWLGDKKALGLSKYSSASINYCTFDLCFSNNAQVEKLRMIWSDKNPKYRPTSKFLSTGLHSSRIRFFMFFKNPKTWLFTFFCFASQFTRFSNYTGLLTLNSRDKILHVYRETLMGNTTSLFLSILSNTDWLQNSLFDSQKVGIGPEHSWSSVTLQESLSHIPWVTWRRIPSMVTEIHEHRMHNTVNTSLGV